MRIPGDEGERVPGLLFADDLVVLAPTRKKREHMANPALTWTKENDMGMGIHMYGVMVKRRSLECLRREPDQWKISGERVPIVKAYTYLGIDFRGDLNAAGMLEGRLAGTKKLVAVLRPFLLTRSIPMQVKMAVLRTVVISRLLFRAEIYRMNKSVTHRM